MSTHFKLATTLVLTAVALVPVGAQSPKTEAGKKSEAVMKADTQGWTSLFDGKTLNGWRGYKKPDTADTPWKVEDSLLTVPPSHARDTKGQRDIISTGTDREVDLCRAATSSPGRN